MDTGGGSYETSRLSPWQNLPILRIIQSLRPAAGARPPAPFNIPGLELMCSHKSVFPSDVPSSTVSSGARGPLPPLSR